MIRKGLLLNIIVIAFCIWGKTAEGCFKRPKPPNPTLGNAGCSFAADDYCNGGESLDASECDALGCCLKEIDCYCSACYCPDEETECSSAYILQFRRTFLYNRSIVSQPRRSKRAAGVRAGPFTYANGDVCTGHEMGAKTGGGNRELKIIARLKETDPKNKCKCTKTQTCILKGNPHESSRYNKKGGQQKFYDNLVNIVYETYIREARQCPPVGTQYYEPWTGITFTVVESDNAFQAWLRPKSIIE